MLPKARDGGRLPSAASSPPAGGAAGRVRETNLFDIMRIVAASMVLWANSYALTGGAPPGWYGNPVGTMGVKIFFIISGLMITRSWLADPRLHAFALRRVLRIIPALALVVVLSAFVLGPIFTTLSLHDYLHAHGTRFYLWNVALYPVYSLPGLFGGLPYPSVVNGSLWSLPAEMAMYIATPFVIGRSVQSARCSVAIFFVVSAIAGLYFVRFVTIAPVPVFYGTSIPSVLEMAPYFQVGALYAVFGLHRFGRPLFSILLFAIVGAGLQALSGVVNEYAVAEVLLLATLPYMVISVGSVTVGGALSRLLQRGDVSYGMYLCGFPVQQTIATLWPGQIGALGNLALTLPVTFVFALFSWKTVEETALRLKPGRPVRKEVQNAGA